MKEETLAIIERVKGRIKIQRVNESMICVNFTRKSGSSWLFFETFGIIHVDLVKICDAYYEPTI